MLACKTVVREFELQSRYYVHFPTNNLGEKYESPYHTIYGLNCNTVVDWFSIK